MAEAKNVGDTNNEYEEEKKKEHRVIYFIEYMFSVSNRYELITGMGSENGNTDEVGR